MKYLYREIANDPQAQQHGTIVEMLPEVVDKIRDDMKYDYCCEEEEINHMTIINNCVTKLLDRSLWDYEDRVIFSDDSGDFLEITEILEENKL